MSWTAPATGGSAITGYTVTSSPGGFVCTTTGATSCTVTGLTNGTGYTFTVTATNAAGTGTASAASATATPATTPGAPTAVTAKATDQSALVSWTAPASNGGAAISSYTVTSSPGALTCSTATTSCSVTGLTAGTAYTFTVTATNGAGTGSASTASGSVTPTMTPTLAEQVSTSGTTSGGTLSTAAFASNTTVGDLVIVQVGSDYTSSIKVSSLSGGGVTTWTKVTQKNGAAAGDGDIEIWYGYVTTAATTAIKVTMSATTADNVELFNASEWSGLVASSPVDTSTNGSGSAASFTAGPITTTVNGDLVVSDAWSSVTGYTSAQNSTTAGYTALGQSVFSSYYRGWAAYQVTGVDGSNSAAWAQSGGTSGFYATAIAAFEPVT